MYFVADIAGGERAVLAGRRVAFGWEAVGLGQPVQLRFEAKGAGPVASLRITVAISMRTCARVGVFAGRTGRALGEFDIRYSPSIQTFELMLNGEAMASVGEAVEL